MNNNIITASYTALSPLDGRYQEALNKLSTLCSEQGLMKQRLFVEVEWLVFLSEQAELPDFPELKTKGKELLRNFAENFDNSEMTQLKDLEKITNHDLKALEYLLKEFCETKEELIPLIEWVHFGCTSEDINNTAYALMIKTAINTHLLPSIEHLHRHMVKLAKEHHNLGMLSRTHGQPASPTSLGKEMANFAYRLNRQMKQLASQEFLGKWNGAVGNFNAHSVAYTEIDWIAISEKFITTLGLSWNPLTTQIEPHDNLAEIFHNIMRINTIFISFARDIWGYISLDYFQQELKAGEIGSSTMPHKVNPIDFENAEGNLGIANSLLSHCADKLPISRWQRDLSDSTVQRNLGVMLGHSALAYRSLDRGLHKLKVNHIKIKADLESHWEVLAEALQSVMRRYGLERPYEQLKNLSRGQVITQEILANFIDGLALPEKVKTELKALSPSKYIGLASRLSLEFINY
jgi:adenylosuccinate lyase